MPDLTIYGSPASRTFRIIWMAKELGLDFANDPIDLQPASLKGRVQ